MTNRSSSRPRLPVTESQYRSLPAKMRPRVHLHTGLRRNKEVIMAQIVAGFTTVYVSRPDVDPSVDTRDIDFVVGDRPEEVLEEWLFTLERLQEDRRLKVLARLTVRDDIPIVCVHDGAVTVAADNQIASFEITSRQLLWRRDCVALTSGVFADNDHLLLIDECGVRRVVAATGEVAWERSTGLISRVRQSKDGVLTIELFDGPTVRLRADTGDVVDAEQS